MLRAWVSLAGPEESWVVEWALGAVFTLKIEPQGWLESSNEHGLRVIGGLSDDVEAVVEAIGEVDVGVAGRPPTLGRREEFCGD